MKRNSIMTSLALGTITAAMLATGAAYAKGQGERGQGGKGGERPSFSELDTNGDGTVTVAEMQAKAAEKFNQVDSNGDGVISAEENAAAATAKAAERAGMMFTRLLEWRDSDGDGALSQVEMGDGQAEKMFSKLDANDDGVISAEEFEQAKERGPRDGGRRGKKGDNSNRQDG
ncbi:MAG: EF-hand domain-containing protein [Paracoccaceae bacterium]